MSASENASYEVLYRRWRPKVFDDVVGQKHITDVLKNQVAKSRIPHALMFCGLRGTGKTSCAKIFAKAVNCLNNSDGNPCLHCEICKKIENGNILDVIEIDAASNNGVENIRTIREESNFVSAESKYKVYIVDEFHMLSAGAFNAFLRTLEDPPRGVIFILATTEFNKIPKTIVSRCQRFDFKRLNVDSISKRLKFVSEKEKIEISDDAIDLISRNSEGSMRDALSILDQCSISSEKIDKNHIMNTLGVSSSDYIENLIMKLINSNLNESIRIVDDLYYQGKNLAKECESIMNFFYDIVHYHSSKSFMENSVNNQDAIIKISSKIGINESIDCYKILEKSYIQMSRSQNVKAELDISIIKIFQRLNMKISFENKTVTDSNNEKSVEKQNKIGDKIDNSSKFMKHWSDVLKSIREEVSESLFAMLKNSSVHFDKNNIFIDTNDVVFGMIKKSYAKVSSVIEKEFGHSYKICKFESDKKDDIEKMGIGSLAEKANEFGIDVKIS